MGNKMSNGKYDFHLYLVMSESCQHCNKLKQNYLGKIKNGIDQLGNIQFIPIELKTMSEKIPNQYPNTLSVYVKWFPTFVLVSSSEIEKSKMSGIPFKASVFNGDYVDNRLTYRNEFPMNDSGILDWCNREISKYSSGQKRILTENESFIPTTVCSKKFKPRTNV
jgi:hypothetical protein